MEAILQSPLGRVVLGATPLTIGSAPDNQVVLNDPSVSPRHAEIHPEDQGYSITDLGSASGTFLNDERLDPRMPRLLFSGQTIRIGNTHFTYEAMNGSQIEPTVSAGSRQGNDAAYPPTAAAPPLGYGSDMQAGAYVPPPPPSPPVYAAGLPSYAVAPTQPPVQKPRKRGLWIALGSIIGLLVIGAAIAVAIVVINLPTPTKVLNAYCTALKAGDYKTAYNQYSSSVQNSFSEAAFAAQLSFLGKPTGCTVGNVTSQNFATLTITYANGATLAFDNQVASDKINYQKLHSTPSSTLLIYCFDLKAGDYQDAYAVLSNSIQSQTSEQQFATAFSALKVNQCQVNSANDAAGTGTLTLIDSSGSMLNQDYTLVQENGNWKISALVGHLPFAMGMCDAEEKRQEGARSCHVQHRSP